MSTFNPGTYQSGDGNLNEPILVGRLGQPLKLGGGTEFTSHGSGPIANRPSADLFGIGTWQDGLDSFACDGLHWYPIKKEKDISPLYIENLVSTGMTTQASSVTSATLQVSGTKGARTLTILSGIHTNFAPTTGKGVSAVLADDTDNDFYFVSVMEVVNSTTINVNNPLPITVTNATLYNRSINDIHYTEQGYRAYAKHLLDFSPIAAQLPNLASYYTLDSVDSWSLTNGLEHVWQPSGAGYTDSSLRYALAVNFWDPINFWAFSSQTRIHRAVYSGAGAAMMTAKIPLTGQTSGYIILECAVASDIWGGQTAEPNSTGIVDVYATSISNNFTRVITKTKIYSGKFYRQVERFIIPFSAGKELQIDISRDTTDGTTVSKALTIGRLDIVTGNIASKQSIIDGLDTVQVFGDSWTDGNPAAYPGFTSELQIKSGATILSDFSYTYPGDTSPSTVNSAKGGTTTAYALDWLDIALKANPSINKVVFNYFTNDGSAAATTVRNFTNPQKTLTDYNVCAYAGVSKTVDNAFIIWANNIKKLIDICLNNKVQPIIMMPAQAGSQTTNHGIMNNLVGNPQKTTEPLATATAADLALLFNPLNISGKYKGKMVIDQSPGGASIAMYIANGPLNSDTWSLFGSATVITPV